jgi:hypothetical protein
MMWRRRDLARLRGLSSEQFRLLMEAVLWLGVARLAIFVIPFRWTTRLFALTALKEAADADPKPGEAPQTVRRIGRVVRAAAARTPWQSACLAQALAGSAMLRRRSIAATLAMGVAKSPSESGGFKAHAWLTCQSVILTGSEGHEKYNVIARFAFGPTSHD